MKRVVISGRAMLTPKSLPVGTRVYCAGCQKHYEVDTDTLMTEGFVCECGKLEMPPRFATKENKGAIYNPRYTQPAVPRRRSVRRVGRGRGR
jgi:hypothetical protein